MKTMGYILKLAVLIFFAVPGYSQSYSSKEFAVLKKGFQQHIEMWRQAYNSGDARALVSLYLPEAEYISSHVPGLVASGRDQLIANFQKGMSLGGHVDWIKLISMYVSGDLATLLCRYKANNAGDIAEGRNLLVLKKVGDKWLIVLHMTVV